MAEFLNIIILVGVIQGLVTATLLFRTKRNKQANRLLAWIILLISLACLNIYLLETFSGEITFILLVLEAIVPLVIIMPIGPLVYFYVRALLNPKFRLGALHKKHFYPVLLDLIPSLVSIGYILGGFFGFINANGHVGYNNFIDTYNRFVDIPRWISLCTYSYLAFVMVKNASNDLDLNYKFWARRFAIGFLMFSTLWFLYLVPYIFPEAFSKILLKVGWYPLYLPLIILVYWLGINGYLTTLKEFKKSSPDIPSDLIETTISKLKRLMTQEKLYRNPKLKLSEVVKKSNIPQKTISAVLNQVENKSFNDFVNGYRIEEFKMRLLSENSEHLTITGLAFESGFNSQATFQRVFKTQVGMSPSEFKKSYPKLI